MSTPPQDDPLLAAFHGPGWRPRIYNLRAALYPFWLSWNGFWGWQIGFMILFLVVGLIVLLTLTDEHTDIGPYVIGVFAAVALLQGFVGDHLLARSGLAARERILASGLRGDEAVAAMRRAARPSRVPFLICVAIGIALYLWLEPSLWGGGYEHPEEGSETRYSRHEIRYSRFDIRYSTFDIRHSTFV